MTKINDYEIVITEAQLDKMINQQMMPVEMIDTSFDGYQGLAEGDKKALSHLVKAARILNDVALEQDHPLNLQLKAGLEKAAVSDTHAAKALKIFNSLNGVAGLNGIDADPVEIFSGVHILKGRNFYPTDLSIEEFHGIISRMIEKGKIDEVRQILSARTMVRRNGDELTAIDYTQYFAKAFSEMANELELAAHYSTNDEFNDYLGWQVQALLQNNEDMDMLADKHWAVLQDTPLEFTLSRENYEDEITPTIFENDDLVNLLSSHNIFPISKDMLGARVGIVNKKGTDLILTFKSQMSQLAKLMPFADKYEQKIDSGDEVKQTMVDVDLATLQGDYAQCRGGITTAQNLPNDDKLSVKTGGGRRNVYHRQVRMSGDKQRQMKILDALLDKEFHQYFAEEAEHIFVIGHENGHSLGPDSSYKDSLGIYKHIIEENKADVVSIAMMPQYVKTNVIDETTLRKVYVTWIMRLLLKSKPQQIHPHRVGDLIHFNYLLKHGAISITSDNKVRIDFAKMPEVMNKILQETIAVQLSKSPQKAQQFIAENSDWGKLHEYIADTLQKIGIKPYKDIRTYL
ncbi:MAG: hypothetical protein IKK52_01310 [Alphaproteobacteria bacterium]|nr:hypothetical protein [Alphaproteobacteria bacterium]